MVYDILSTLLILFFGNLMFHAMKQLLENKPLSQKINTLIIILIVIISITTIWTK